MSSVDSCLKLGDSKSFEFPYYNQIWYRDLTKQVLRDNLMSHGCQVLLCQAGLRTKEGCSIDKSLGFVSSHYPLVKVL